MSERTVTEKITNLRACINQSYHVRKSELGLTNLFLILYKAKVFNNFDYPVKDQSTKKFIPMADPNKIHGNWRRVTVHRLETWQCSYS